MNEAWPEVAERNARWARAVAACPWADPICAGPLWGRAALAALEPVAEPVFVVGNEGGLVVGQVIEGQLGAPDPTATEPPATRRWLVAVETRWGFATPILAPTVEAGWAVLDAAAAVVPFTGVLCTAATPQSPWFASPLASAAWQVTFTSPSLGTVWADLHDGAEAWWARRSTKFRASLRAAERRCQASGLVIDFLPATLEPKALVPWLQEVAQVEAASWKWAASESIFQHREYRHFYAALLRLAGAEGAAAGALVREAATGRAVAYNLGLRVGRNFRGLQQGYAEAVRALGVGNWLQWSILRQQAHLGVVRYDFGMPVDYKQAWCDHLEAQSTVVLVRR